MDLVNTVNINSTFAETSEDGSKESNWSYVDSGASGSVTHKYEFYKVDSNSYAVRLSGATFELYKYVGTSSGTDGTDETGGTGWKLDKTFTSDGDGLIRKISQTDFKNSDETYYTDTAYYLVETEAPEGYVKSDTKYYFYCSSSDDASGLYPSDWSSNSEYTNAVDLRKTSWTSYVENSCPTTSVSVNKTWTGSDSNPTSLKVYLKKYAVSETVLNEKLAD
jgi:hypothetical protein